MSYLWILCQIIFSDISMVNSGNLFLVMDADMNLIPELSAKLRDIPVRPCFAVMLAFAEPLTSV